MIEYDAETVSKLEQRNFALELENERLKTIIKMARERLHDAHGRQMPHETYLIIHAVGNILRRGDA